MAEQPAGLTDPPSADPPPAGPAAANQGNTEPSSVDATSASPSPSDELLKQAAASIDPSGAPSAEPAPASAPADHLSNPGASPSSPFSPVPSAAPSLDEQLLGDQASIDDLLRQASFEDPSAIDGAAFSGGPASGSASPDADRFSLPSFQQVMRDAQASSIDLLRDVELNVKIELGRSRMLVEDVLRLSEGSVVELDKLAGDPVDVFVNDRLVARGEVLVLNDNFCVRVNEIVAGVKDEGI